MDDQHLPSIYTIGHKQYRRIDVDMRQVNEYRREFGIDIRLE